MMTKLKRISTLGDGLCFYHSVLQAISPDYHTGDKAKLAKELNEYICLIYHRIKDKGFLTIEQEAYNDLNKIINSQMLDDKMLCEGKESDDAIIAFSSIVLNLNIIVIDLSSTGKYKRSLLIAKPNHSRFIIIAWTGECHYETVAFDNKTTFTADDKVITELIGQLKLKNYWTIFD